MDGQGPPRRSLSQAGQARPVLARPRHRHHFQREGVGLMADEPNRIRVGERITIFPRGTKKTWCADFWQDGVHRKVSLKTSNKKVAIERATKLAADLTGGAYRQAPPAITVKQAVEDYLTSLKTE